MRSCNIGDKLAQQQVKEGPAKEAWIKEQVKFEIDRLKAVLRDSLATDEEKSIAQSQIANYQEMAAITERPLPGWLPQMDLLADPDDNHCRGRRRFVEPRTVRADGADGLEVTLVKDHKHNGEDKRPLLLEDLRHHSPEQLAELRLLLESGTPLEPIRESEAFFAVEGPLHIFYVCKNHAGTEVVLIVARKRPPTSENEKFRMSGETCDSISSFWVAKQTGMGGCLSGVGEVRGNN